MLIQTETLSIRISKAESAALRKRARDENISMEKLCAWYWRAMASVPRHLSIPVTIKLNILSDASMAEPATYPPIRSILNSTVDKLPEY